MAEGDIAGAATTAITNPQGFADAVYAGLYNAVMEFAKMIPNLILAVLLVVIGWIVGIVIANIVKKLLEAIKLEKFLETHKVEDALGGVKVSKVLVQLMKYYVMLIFLQSAVALISLGQLSLFLTDVINFVPKVIAAVIVVVVAAIIGELAKEKILEIHEKEEYMRMLAGGAKYLAIFFGVMVGLDTMGFQTAIIKDTFYIIIGMIGAGVALAFGLAFGFGGQEFAKDLIKDWRKRVQI